MRSWLSGRAARVACWFVLPWSAALGAVELPEIFADHMVLQRSASTPIWGRGTPGEQVTVRLGDDVLVESTPGADGRWRVALDTREIPPGPHTLRIGERTIHDVLIGEVWLASGQSNMEFILRDTLGATEEMAAAQNPAIRQFLVAKRAEDAPADDLKGRWMLAAGEDFGQFSAVGYYFARTLQRELDRPVAIINSTRGGSACEAWMSAPAIESLPAVAERARETEEDIRSYPQRKEEFVRAFNEWTEKTNRADRRERSAGKILSVPESQWSPVHLPGPPPAPPEPGAVWLRRTVDIPASLAGQPLRILLGTVEMLDALYWNGELVGETSVETFETGRYAVQHTVPAKLVKEGQNDIALRIYSAAKTPWVSVSVEYFRAGPVPISGEWLMLREWSLPAPDSPAPQAPRQLPLVQNFPSRLYNGMIAPLVPYGIAGVIWYQGENNVSRAADYGATFSRLITDWRARWSDDSLPFLWCQLANYRAKQETPGDSDWARLREAQSAALALPATAQIVTIDVGEAGDIHPRDKLTPGTRLARVALARHYQRPGPHSGPVFESMEIKGEEAVLHFREVGDGLEAAPLAPTYTVRTIPPSSAPLVRARPDSPLEGFAICGEDRQWVWADARIEGETVVVCSDDVKHPVAVRYAWADNPTANLRSSNGWPATPFRTDDFPPEQKAP